LEWVLLVKIVLSIVVLLLLVGCKQEEDVQGKELQVKLERLAL